MGLEEVKRTIELEAKQEAKCILAEARKEASKIVAAAKQQVQAEEEQFKKELDSNLHSLENREIASAEFTARKMLLVRKRELLDSFFEACMEAASSLPVKTRREHVAHLIDHMVKGFPISVVYARKGDAPSLEGINVVPMDIAGGVIVETSDGSQRLDFTYETMLKHIRTHFLLEIAAELFGK